MTPTAVFSCYGLVARVECETRAQLDAIAAALTPPWGREAGAKPDVSFELAADGTITQDGRPAPPRLTGENGVRGLEWTLRHHLAVHAPEHVFIHAGVVSLGATGILIPGRSMSGKTTLVHELVQRGATYHSDEYAVVGRDGLVHPYARPLMLRSRDAPHQRAAVTSPPARVATGPVVIRLVLAPRHVAGTRWEPRRLTRAEGAMVLLDNTVVARLRPAESLAAARDIMHTADCWQGARGEADEAAEAILALAADSVSIET